MKLQKRSWLAVLLKLKIKNPKHMLSKPVFKPSPEHFLHTGDVSNKCNGYIRGSTPGRGEACFSSCLEPIQPSIQSVPEFIFRGKEDGT
jgi:hypothetical protein